MGGHRTEAGCGPSNGPAWPPVARCGTGRVEAPQGVWQSMRHQVFRLRTQHSPTTTHQLVAAIRRQTSPKPWALSGTKDPCAQGPADGPSGDRCREPARRERFTAPRSASPTGFRPVFPTPASQTAATFSHSDDSNQPLEWLPRWESRSSAAATFGLECRTSITPTPWDVRSRSIRGPRSGDAHLRSRQSFQDRGPAADRWPRDRHPCGLFAQNQGGGRVPGAHRVVGHGQQGARGGAGGRRGVRGCHLAGWPISKDLNLAQRGVQTPTSASIPVDERMRVPGPPASRCPPHGRGDGEPGRWMLAHPQLPRALWRWRNHPCHSRADDYPVHSPAAKLHPSGDQLGGPS